MIKLYTEEQVITFAIKVLSDYEINGTFYNREKLKETLDVTPIELPSDEEIENNAYTDRRVEDLEYHEQIGFERGALWLKEQILKQTNVGNDGFEFDNSSTIPPTKGLCDAKSIYGDRELTIDERMHLWFVDKKPNRDVCDSVDELSDEEKHKYFDECNITRTIQIDIPTIINK